MHELLPQELVEALESEATIVTANQRAAHWVRRAFNQHNHSLSRSTWKTPSVLAWENWTARLWTQLIMEGRTTEVLLSGTQQHVLWRQILSQDEELASGSLHNMDALAELAARAWQLLWSYGAETRLRSLGGGPDIRAFQRWAQAFEEECSGRMLSSAQLESRLIRALRSNALSVGHDIFLLGFDSFTPARRSLLEALRTAGTNITELPLGVSSPQPSILELPDEHTELYAAARWIGQYLSDHDGARIAMIVPNLEEQVSTIDRVFREVLAPQLEDVATSLQTAPWEFSLGVSLARTPMVAVALDLLRWANAPLSLETVSHLMQSPWFAMVEDERNPRAEFDAFELRHLRTLRPELTLASFTSMVATSRRKDRLTHLLSALRVLERAATGAPTQRRTWAEWAEHFGRLLDAARWGASAGEDSIEFQTRRRWESALDELSSLDLHGDRVNYSRALSTIEWIAQKTMFAPESRQASVQVMGPLEAAGTRFDAIWFLGAGEFSWPVPAQRNALLPWQLQREFRMPGIESEVDDERARRITDRIAGGAATVIFSYAAQTRSGRQQRSSLLNAYDLQYLEPTPLPSLPQRATTTLEIHEDAQPLPPLPDAVSRGGAEILRLQAACGFRAFAERRLWSAELKRLEPGMDAAERGNVVHHALQSFWTEVKTQSALKAMQTSERDAAIDRAVASALERATRMASSPWERSYVETQRMRLINLMRSWLELEAARTPFTVSMSEREFDDVRVGPLRMKVRVDRVDRGEEGEIFIDYKSGKVSPSAWLTDRPDQPQLPLYTMLSGAEKIEGVAFGLLRAGEEMTLTGYSTTAGSLTKTSALKGVATLEEQIDRWRHVLVQLAEEFHSGKALVDPKQFPSTCEHCAQRILCRFDVTTAIEDDGGDSERV